MSPALRPSDLYGRPDAPRHEEGDAGTTGEPHGPRWLVRGGLAVLAIVVTGFLVAPDDVGEGGVPPAAVDIISEDQAIAALALYRAQAETHDALAVDRSLYTPPGPGVVREAAGRGRAIVAMRLDEARQMPDADPAVAHYWSASAHDAHLVQLRQAERDMEEIAVLALIHDTIYDGAGGMPLVQAELELTGRYSTGVADRDRPMFAWGRALLGELDGVDGRAQADQARTMADSWWQERAAALQPPVTDALRAYLGGLPTSTVRGLEGHPLAGPGLDLLRSAG